MEVENIKEIELVLDENLKQIEIVKDEVKEQNFKNRLLKEKSDKIVRDTISGDVLHMNYISYLAKCWDNHYGVVFTPDYVWQIILGEIATFIKDNSEQYKHLFTTNTGDGKTEISIPTNDMELIDIEKIMEELKKLVPTNTDIFVPEFSTTTFPTSLAFKATFADAMTPFYSYSMYCCGIPKVKILGRKKDWKKIINNLIEINELFNNKSFSNYFIKVRETITEIIDNKKNPDFWKDMFQLERCGSGGQVEVKGWITNFYMKQPSPRYTYNYPTSVAYVPYKNLSTDKNYELIYGLFSSEIDGDYLVPEFSYLVAEK